MIDSINLAMKMTLLRIVLTPCVVFAILYNQWSIALILSIIAGLTDFLDGYYARRYNQETDTGKIMDPVADKIFIVSTLSALYIGAKSSIIPWWFIMVYVIKELVLLCGAGFLVYRKRTVLSPSLLAKIVTALQMIFMICIIVLYVVCENGCILHEILETIFRLFTGAFILIFIDYGYKFYKLL